MVEIINTKQQKSMTKAQTTSSTIFAVLAVVSVIALLILPAATFAAAPEMTDGFICPVFNDGSAVGEHNPNAVPIDGGDYSIIGPDVRVPTHATNGDGAGTPGGPHSSPGDSDYTAIWSK